MVQEITTRDSIEASRLNVCVNVFLKFFLLQEFHCHLCPKEFMQKRQLSVHIKRHLGQKVVKMEKIYSANF